MSDYSKDIERRFNNLSDEELMRVIEVDKGEYTEEALSIVKAVIEKRGGIEKLEENVEKVLPQEKAAKDSPSPIQRSQSQKDQKAKGSVWQKLFSYETLLYILGILLCSGVGVVVCSDSTGLLHSTVMNILEVFIALTVIFWIAIALDNFESDIFGSLAIAAITLFPIAAMFLDTTSDFPKLSFWSSLIIWVIITSIFVSDKAQNVDGWEKFLLIMGCTWSVASTIVFIGRTSWLPFAIVATESLRAVHILLDLRYFIGILFFGALMVTSLTKAFKQTLPEFQSIKPWRIDEPDEREGLFSSLMLPFIIVANAFLLFLNIITDYLWRAIRILFTFFGHIGQQLAILVNKFFLEIDALRVTLKVLATFFLCVFIFKIVTNCTAPVEAYLRATLWLEQLSSLAIITGWSTVILICMGGIFWLMEITDFSKIRTPVIFGLAMILSVFLISGAVLYRLSGFENLLINGFGAIGPFSTILLFLIVAGFIKMLMKKKTQTAITDKDRASKNYSSIYETEDDYAPSIVSPNISAKLRENKIRENKRKKSNDSRFFGRILLSPIIGLFISFAICFIIDAIGSSIRHLSTLWFSVIFLAPTTIICIILSNIGPLRPIPANKELILDSSVIWSVLFEIVFLVLIYYILP